MNLRIASPCSASWAGMAGDERVRFCSLCNLNVYNFAEMTRDEIRELVLRSEGRVCGRMYRRADGTFLTRDCPAGLRALRKRMSRIAGATFAALFSFASFAFGDTTCKKRGDVEIRIEQSAAPQKAVFTGVVLFGGNPLPGATVTLCSETDQQRTAITDVNGAFTIPSIDDGVYRVEVTLDHDLKPAGIEQLQLNANEVTTARFAVQLDGITDILSGAVAVDDFMTEGVSTTFSQDFINKLPI